MQGRVRSGEARRLGPFSASMFVAVTTMAVFPFIVITSLDLGARANRRGISHPHKEHPMDEPMTNAHHRHRWTPSSVLHMLGAARGFWSSDLNSTVVGLADPQPGMALLDVGPGLGPATVTAAQHVGPSGTVIAVEPSAPLRGVLRVRRLWQRSRAVIDIRRGTAESLPVQTDSIDRAYSVNATHHFNDVPLAIAELVRVLKPGGRILLVDEDFTNDQHPYHHRESFHAPDPVDAIHIVSLLTDAGLSAASVEHQPIGGLAATVITATAPLPGQPADTTSTRDDTGESS